MPGLIGVGEFVDETREDYNSPTTSTFVSRMPQCRQTISALEEVRVPHKYMLQMGVFFLVYIYTFSIRRNYHCKLSPEIRFNLINNPFYQNLNMQFFLPFPSQFQINLPNPQPSLVAREIPICDSAKEILLHLRFFFVQVKCRRKNRLHLTEIEYRETY